MCVYSCINFAREKFRGANKKKKKDLIGSCPDNSTFDSHSPVNALHYAGPIIGSQERHKAQGTNKLFTGMDTGVALNFP